MRPLGTKANFCGVDLGSMPLSNKDKTPNCDKCDYLIRSTHNLKWACDFACRTQRTRARLGVKIRPGGGCCVKCVRGKRVEYPTPKEAWAIRKALPKGLDDTFRMWALGKTDKQIAKQGGVREEKVAQWRKMHHIPKNEV